MGDTAGLLDLEESTKVEGCSILRGAPNTAGFDGCALKKVAETPNSCHDAVTQPAEIRQRPTSYFASSKRASFLMRQLLLLLLAALAIPCRSAEFPNVVFILCDDLGYGDIGAFGQTKIRTPNIDRLAAEGMRLTSHYSGNNVCAPSRCVLLTGRHPGHVSIRDNRQASPKGEGQVPVTAGELQFPLRLKKLGYTVGAFGKWGLGPVGSAGDPLNQGFDRFFGYNCQAVAHNHYPTQLWDNNQPRPLANPPFAAHQKLSPDADMAAAGTFASFSGKEYSPDVITAEALRFIRDNRERPFFLFYPTTVPHLALQVPADSLAEYSGAFNEEPYPGGHGYLPHRTPRAAYAAMITRLDREIGRLLQALKDSGLDDRTMVVFTSDNGPLYDKLGGTDAEFFNSAGGLRGRKGSMYEGGIRVPTIIRWPGRIRPGSVSDRVTGFEDWMPTILEMAGHPATVGDQLDGVSFAQTLLGKEQPERTFLYRESPGYGGQQTVRVGNWKLLRQKLNLGKKAKPEPPIAELYDLSKDRGETTNVATEHPEIVAQLLQVAAREHVKSEQFPIAALDR
jgi:arylsulfatase A-like enzyme